MSIFQSAANTSTVPIHGFTTQKELSKWLKNQDKITKSWAKAHDFTAKTGSFLLIPGQNGQIRQVLIGIPEKRNLFAGKTEIFAFAPLVAALTGLATDSFEIKTPLNARAATQAAIGWGLATYRFTRYTPKNKKTPPRLVWPKKADRKQVKRTIAAQTLVRDLINTPANDLGPADLVAAVKKLGKQYDARVTTLRGKQLVEKNYPAIYEVGKGSAREPYLADLRWGNAKHPKVTLVGKGIVFDSGGYDIKPDFGMRSMKKDMGGSAHVLGLAQMIMDAKLPVRLRVLIPAAENSISGEAFRPGDVIKTRKGLSVEIDNTDAEGRLVLCDAITEACREKPELLIDFATLTGAARVAVGLEIAAMFTNNDELAVDLNKAAREAEDPIWQQPLYEVYGDDLKTPIADLVNSCNNLAGAVTAALFLKNFVEDDVPWVHFDVNAENPKTRPGRPKGGEAQGMRAVFAMLEKRFGKKKA